MAVMDRPVSEVLGVLLFGSVWQLRKAKVRLDSVRSGTVGQSGIVAER